VGCGTETDVLGKRQQQQVEKCQPRPHETVLYRVDGQSLENVEQKEPGKGKCNKKQCVFDGAIGLQVLI